MSLKILEIPEFKMVSTKLPLNLDYKFDRFELTQQFEDSLIKTFRLDSLQIRILSESFNEISLSCLFNDVLTAFCTFNYVVTDDNQFYFTISCSRFTVKNWKMCRQFIRKFAIFGYGFFLEYLHKLGDLHKVSLGINVVTHYQVELVNTHSNIVLVDNNFNKLLSAFKYQYRFCIKHF